MGCAPSGHRKPSARANSRYGASANVATSMRAGVGWCRGRRRRRGLPRDSHSMGGRGSGDPLAHGRGCGKAGKPNGLWPKPERYSQFCASRGHAEIKGVGRHRRTEPRQGRQYDMPPPFWTNGGVRRPRPTFSAASFRLRLRPPEPARRAGAKRGKRLSPGLETGSPVAAVYGRRGTLRIRFGGHRPPLQKTIWAQRDSTGSGCLRLRPRPVGSRRANELSASLQSPVVAAVGA
jgi:hypothetical protein